MGHTIDRCITLIEGTGYVRVNPVSHGSCLACPASSVSCHCTLLLFIKVARLLLNQFPIASARHLALAYT